MDLWIMIVILAATTILAAIAGVLISIFVKNRRTEYAFDVPIDLVEEDVQ
jgi:hypothetical protein